MISFIQYFSPFGINPFPDKIVFTTFTQNKQRHMSFQIHTRLKIFFVIALSMFILDSCYYDNEEELYSNEVCDTENMSYQADIVPILERNCQLCHSEAAAGLLGAGFNLEGHSNLIVHVNSGALAGSIRHDAGWSPMPKGGGKIPDCDIAKIESWIQSGSPDN
jgi:hypothetical protein